MIDPQTGQWREMIDPTTRKPSQVLQLTVGRLGDSRSTCIPRP